MSVEFTGAVSQYISFTAPAAAGMNTYSISFWVYIDSLADVYFLYLSTGTATDQVYTVTADSSKVAFSAHFNTADGFWRTTNVVLSALTWLNIIITYDGSSTSNKPIIYVNGASKAVSTLTSASGTHQTGTGANLLLSSLLDGKEADVRIYSSVLTAAQVLALYNDGPFTPNYDTDLVFHAPLTKSTALSGSSFDGYTLTSSQKLVDRIGCAEGTPSGSPLGSNTNPT